MSEQNDVTATVLDAKERPDLYISIGVKLVGEDEWWLSSNAASTQSNIRNNGIIVCIPGHATLRKQAEEREARDAELAELARLRVEMDSLRNERESICHALGLGADADPVTLSNRILDIRWPLS